MSATIPPYDKQRAVRDRMPSVARAPGVVRLIELALEEDIGRGDATTAAVIDGSGGPAEAVILAKAPMVVYGLEIVAAVFSRVDPELVTLARVADGARVEPGTIVADVRGPAASILLGERTALNFLQRLSGVATQSRRYALAVADTKARVVDTRKTTPGFRLLEKMAVQAGGCSNHRFDLGSGVLIKDNHIAACGSVATAVTRARARVPHSLRVEVEVTTLSQLEEALAAGADIVLLDNMELEQVQIATARAHAGGRLVEVSGGITFDKLGALARAGVDLISVGALTHSAPAVDLSLELVPRG